MTLIRVMGRQLQAVRLLVFERYDDLDPRKVRPVTGPCMSGLSIMYTFDSIERDLNSSFSRVRFRCWCSFIVLD